VGVWARRLRYVFVIDPRGTPKIHRSLARTTPRKFIAEMARFGSRS